MLLFINIFFLFVRSFRLLCFVVVVVGNFHALFFALTAIHQMALNYGVDIFQ